MAQTITMTEHQLGELVRGAVEVALKQQQQQAGEPKNKKAAACAAGKKKGGKKGGKKENESICWAKKRTGETCSNPAAHKDGLCGTHHAMKKRGEPLGPKAKELNQLCEGQTKKGKGCKNHAMDGERYCYHHL